LGLALCALGGLSACTGPGLEPPGDSNGRGEQPDSGVPVIDNDAAAGGAGVGAQAGSAGTGGVGGMMQGSGGMGGAGGAAEDDAGLDDAGDDDGGTDSVRLDP
jgi:hypothetical protein